LAATKWIIAVVYLTKWRAARELWSVDWLDIVYRAEKEFGIAITVTDFEHWSAEGRSGLTAGQLWNLVATKLRTSGMVVPVDGWARAVRLLSKSLDVRPARVSTDSRLYVDLGMSYFLD
jgi:hypothetical protein